MGGNSSFGGGGTVSVDAAGALNGDGSSGSPLAVNVDGVTVTVNGSNELVSASGSGDVAGPAGATDGHLAVFNGGTGKVIKDGGAPFASVTLAAASGVTGDGTAGTPLAVNPDGTTVQLSSDKVALIPWFSLWGQLRNPKCVKAFSAGLATGDTDLYTCPASRRAIVGSYAQYNNSGVGAIVSFGEVKHSGTYYRVSNNGNSNNGAGARMLCSVLIEAGDIFALNTITNNGLNVVVSILEFDASSQLTQGQLFGLNTGDNTLYTCPANTTAVLVGPLNSGQMAFPGQGTTCGDFVADGTNRNVYANVVASGDTPSTSNKISAATLATANTRIPFGVPGTTLSAGDYVSINVDVGDAAQYATCWVVEFAV